MWAPQKYQPSTPPPVQPTRTPRDTTEKLGMPNAPSAPNLIWEGRRLSAPHTHTRPGILQSETPGSDQLDSVTKLHRLPPPPPLASPTRGRKSPQQHARPTRRRQLRICAGRSSGRRPPVPTCQPSQADGIIARRRHRNYADNRQVATKGLAPKVGRPKLLRLITDRRAANERALLRPIPPSSYHFAYRPNIIQFDPPELGHLSSL